MYRPILLFLIFNLLLMVASCSSEGEFLPDEPASLIDEQLSNAWDLYDVYLTKDLDSALFYMQQVKNIAQVAAKPKWLANAYWGIAGLQIKQGHAGEAVYNFLRAAEVFEEMEDLLGLANIYLNLGDVYSRAGDERTALYYLNRSKNIFMYEGSSSDKASIFRDIGIHYYSTGKYKEAGELLSMAEKAALGSKDYHLLSLIYNSFGVANFKQNKYPEAQMYYELTIQYSDSLENGDWHKSLAYNNIGEAYFFEGKDSIAMEWLHKAIVFGEKQQRDPILVQNSRNLYAQLLIRNNDFSGAIALLEEGLSGFDSVVVDKTINESLVLINKALVKINEEVGGDPLRYPQMNKMLVDYNQKLLKFNSRSSGFEKSLERISQQQAIQAAAERYAYKEQLDLAEQRNAKMKYLILAPVLLLMGALLWAYVAFRRNRHYKKLYGNIEQILDKSKALRKFPRN